jgi:hypothetical protein
MYLNSITIAGFVVADPEQRQSRNNGAKFTVLSVATQRSWKNAQDEWSSKTECHADCISRRVLRSTSLRRLRRLARPRRRERDQPTSVRMAEAKGPRPPRSCRGPFAPMSYEGSTVATLNRKRLLPIPILRRNLTNQRSSLHSSAARHRARAFGRVFVLCWLLFRPLRTNLTLHTSGVAAYVDCARTAFPRALACDSFSLKIVRARFPKTTGALPQCRRES